MELKQLLEELSNPGVMLDAAQVTWIAQVNKRFEIFHQGSHEEIVVLLVPKEK